MRTKINFILELTKNNSLRWDKPFFHRSITQSKINIWKEDYSLKLTSIACKGTQSYELIYKWNSEHDITAGFKECSWSLNLSQPNTDYAKQYKHENDLFFGFKPAPQWLEELSALIQVIIKDPNDKELFLATLPDEPPAI